MGKPVDFTIPDEPLRVRSWLIERLQRLSGVRYRESQGAGVVLGEPMEENPHRRGVISDVAVPARRVKSIPILDDWGLIPDWKDEMEPLDPVMRFRIAALAGKTYVIATCDCDERLSGAQEDFLKLLKEVQADYPEVGPFWQGYETELRERQKDYLTNGFGDTGRAAAANEGEPDTTAARTEAVQEAQPQTDSAAPPRRRRGRKLSDPTEINKICADWYKVQDRETQYDFCNRKGISVSCLRRWLKHYPYPGSDPGG